MLQESLHLLVFLVGVYYFFYGISLAVNNVKSLNFLLKNKRKIKLKKLNPTINFIILVPVLKEEKIIKTTLEYLSSFKYPLSKLKIIVITTQRELVEQKSISFSQNTIKIVKEIIPILNHKLKREVFIHYHYPFSFGKKADQLNFALKKLNNQNPQIFKDRLTYLGLYDADSTSDPNTLKILAKDAKKNNYPLVYQQPVIYLKNYSTLPFTIDDYLMKSFALLQTCYSLGYEVPMFLNSSKNIKRRIGKMAYCLGHGLFVRADFLKKIGFFPTPIEDTRFGHILSYLRCKIKLLPSLAVTEVVRKFKWLLNQESAWFIGESYFLEDYKIAKRIKKIDKIWALSLIFYKFYRNFIWASEGLIFVSVILIGAFLSYKIFLLPFIAGFLIYIYFCCYFLLVSYKKILYLCNYKIEFYPCKRDYFLMLFFLPLTAFLLFLGPQLGFIRFLKAMFIKKTPLIPKTPR